MTLPRRRQMQVSAVFAVFAAIQLAACDHNPPKQAKSATDGSTPKGVLRYKKYVVEVDTPQGVVSGYSVFGAMVDCGNSFPVGAMCGLRQRSEAVAVILPNGRKLYSLLTRQGERQYACCAYASSWKPDTGKPYAEFREDQYPDLVMFDDDNVPSSVKLIDPSKLFGDNYRIKRIYTQPTNMRETHNITNHLPWLSFIDTKLNGHRTGWLDGPVAGYLSKTNFLEDDFNANSY